MFNNPNFQSSTLMDRHRPPPDYYAADLGESMDNLESAPHKTQM